MQKLDLDTLMNDELGEKEKPFELRYARDTQPVQPEQKTDFVGMPIRPLGTQTLDQTIQDAKELPFAIADFAAAMLPGAGVSEAVGTGVENPVSSALGKEEAMPIPSLKKDVEEGNYLDAGLKGLGVVGDALTLAGTGLALTGIGSGPGAALIATGLAAKGISKYGEGIAKSIAKIGDIDEEAAKEVALRLDDFAEKDRPEGHAIQMVKGALKKAKAKQTAGIGHNNPPRATAPTREGLGLFSRAEEAVANMDIPKEGISADALMARLRDDPDVPNDEIDFGLALMTQPNTKITRDMLDDLFANTFGIKETRLRGDDTEYAEFAQYRLPDEPGSAYTETVFQARLVDGQPSWISNEHFEDFAENQIGHMRTSIRNTDDGKRVLVIEEIQADAYKADKGAVKDKEVPFKNKAGYTNMILARAMRTAAEQDLDGVMVLNAAEQIKRNKDSFEGVIDTIESRTPSADYFMPDTKMIKLEMKEGSPQTYLVDKEGKIVQAAFQERLVGKNLSDLIGSKETADKLLKEDTVVDAKDRVVGESGYKTVYDNRIPKRLNDIVKRMDADGTVDKGTLKVSEYDIYAGIESDTFMDAIEMDGKEFVDKIAYGLADDTAEGYIHSKIMKDAHDRYDDAFRNEFFEYTDEASPYPYDGVTDTIEDLLEDGFLQLRGSGRNRKKYAQEIFLMYGDRFNQLGDAEDWLDDYLDRFFNGPYAYMKRQIEKKRAKGGDNIRTIENNTRVLFTPEMKAEILGRGLPRLRTGGLVGKK